VYVQGMEKRIAIGIKLPPSLVNELDRALKDFEFEPTRTEYIERAVRERLERDRKAREKKGRA
jgi:metal-responsive CopG/Arc/MetJ family transcriptional regulator